MTTTNYTPESNVLAPLDPSTTTDSNEWPDFELNNVRVHLPNDRAATTSLLVASEHYPVTVVGDVQLHSIPKELSHTIKQQNHGRTASIEILEVRSFAYGQFDDGTIGLWASGRAGWFRLKPARAYREIYNGMIEGIGMLYFVADAYREERRSGKGKKATKLPPYTAGELFEKYGTEVMKISPAVGMAAEKVYQHVDFLFASMLAGKEGIDWTSNPLYLHLKAKCSEQHAAVKQRIAGPPQKPAPTKRQPSIESASTNISLKRKRGRPPKGQDPESISVASSSTTSNTRASRRPGTIIHAQHPKPPQQHTRRTRQRTSETTSEEPSVDATPLPEISDSEDGELAIHAGKGKSALRLKPSRGAKGKKGGKAPVIEDEESEDEPVSSPTAAAQRIVPHDQQRHGKGGRYKRAEVDEGIDMPDSPPTSEPEATLGAPDDDGDVDPLTAEDAARMEHDVDPVQEDTWRCALDGCTHKVYLASRPESQRLIREHYALHAYDDDERVRLVKKLQAPSLPVDRLMEKVRLQAAVEGFPASRVVGSRFPEPIGGRRY
ncbi:hypothetical protein LTR56_006078 [Elasticomyces elasticus]|nr:hypothetical protein LTR56_006078 [Elasticomyces elasticus]KAK3667660.1 hypothetical protein LTR22_001475 [Elasticomyces elasticus]KAK4928385.1 hypothetical protein LTR49_004792 [Elasticomyces elasticus]KAK5767186.1 hypothetical protein LTS12_002644 [Elasticomyces elasticus]